MALKLEEVLEDVQNISRLRQKLLLSLRSEMRGMLTSHADNVEYIHKRLLAWDKQITKLEGGSVYVLR